jgi:hypothetical protein
VLGGAWLALESSGTLQDFKAIRSNAFVSSLLGIIYNAKAQLSIDERKLLKTKARPGGFVKSCTIRFQGIAA